MSHTGCVEVQEQMRSGPGHRRVQAEASASQPPSALHFFSRQGKGYGNCKLQVTSGRIAHRLLRGLRAQDAIDDLLRLM